MSSEAPGNDAVTLTTVPNEFEAAMVANVLHEQNIDVRTVGDFTSGFPWETRKVSIIVRQRDLERAREALATPVQAPGNDSPQALSHFDSSGASHMVDVGQKPATHRMARASGVVAMQAATRRLILDRQVAKGDVLEISRLAGIMAAKRTSELIPLCHPLALDAVRVHFQPLEENLLRIEAVVEVEAKTGVEMEALTAVTVAALTVYDMCKSVDRGMQIRNVQLEEKHGGRSGHFRRDEPSS